jgi:hypothetical protein
VAGLDTETLRECLRREGAACALALLSADEPLTNQAWSGRISEYRSQPDAIATLRQLCDAALHDLHLPRGLGFFVDETPRPEDHHVGAAAAVAILGARSGRLYLPGRFEPSLIALGDVTLMFPEIAPERESEAGHD